VGIDSERRYTNLFSSGSVPFADLRLLEPLCSPERPSSIQTTLVARQVLCIFPQHASSTHLASEVEMGGFEPPTSRVQGGRSPTELHPRTFRILTGERIVSERRLPYALGGPAWNRTGDLSLIRTAL
jgi:hypothetical protein